ncbi:MAG: NADPH-dependent FMN reductase [Caulobacterales bacterium 68-7]|nr:flavodoxin family protein [Caulobacterales bacterium]OJU11018.1 MAG: NADPH-dependent FMN reductase [Caulobacterales bacterium 68-7]
MTTVAVVYHSGYGHTEVLAEQVAEGVRASGAEARLLKIENAAQDFGPLLDQVSSSDAVVFGAPTYMGDVSAAFRAFTEASSRVFATGGWGDKLAAGFTNSHSFSGDKTHALTSLAIFAAQHGMNWVNLGVPAPSVTAAERGPETLNRVGAFLGLAAQSDNASTEITPPTGDRRTAWLLGERVAKAAQRWSAGQSAEPLAQAA